MRAPLPAIAALLSALSLANCQTYTDCDPTKNSCPADPALGKTITTDFTKGASEDWTVATGTNLSYNSNGANFVISEKKQAPTITSAKYIFFGKISAVIRAAPGQGIVSAVTLQSDDLDEIDWEWLGGVDDSVQTNMFGKGVSIQNNEERNSDVASVQETWHTYTVDWTQSAIKWYIDDNLVRTALYTDYDSSDGANTFPQTPMRIKMGSWIGCVDEAAASDPATSGTCSWAGGPADWSKAPFNMYIKSITVEDYSCASEYVYGDKSGTYKSIKSVGSCDGNTTTTTPVATSTKASTKTSTKISTTSAIMSSITPTTSTSAETPVKSSTESPATSPSTSPIESATKSPIVSATGYSNSTTPIKSSTESPATSPIESATKSPIVSPTGSPIVSPIESSTGSPIVSFTESPIESATGSPIVSIESSTGYPITTHVTTTIGSLITVPATAPTTTRTSTARTTRTITSTETFTTSIQISLVSSSSNPEATTSSTPESQVTSTFPSQSTSTLEPSPVPASATSSSSQQDNPAPTVTVYSCATDSTSLTSIPTATTIPSQPGIWTPPGPRGNSTGGNPSGGSSAISGTGVGNYPTTFISSAAVTTAGNPTAGASSPTPSPIVNAGAAQKLDGPMLALCIGAIYLLI